jgi:hypothetical protein
MLDANVFIQGPKLHYGWDSVRDHWDWIDQQSAAGKPRAWRRSAVKLRSV